VRLEPAKIVLVTGVASGVGKTALSRRVAALVEASGRTVELFDETDILERKEFSEVIASFRSTGVASIRQLLDASNRYVMTSVAGDVDVFVQDMLFPFLPSLLAWGHSDEEIISFFAALAECCEAVELLQVHVTGDAAESLQRAVGREGQGWLESLITKVATYADTIEDVDDVDSLILYLESAERRSQRLLASAPWPVVIVDGATGTEDTAVQAIAALKLLDPAS